MFGVNRAKVDWQAKQRKATEALFDQSDIIRKDSMELEEGKRIYMESIQLKSQTRQDII